MDRLKQLGCAKCDRIAREIDESLAEIVRATDGNVKIARKRAARALEDQRQHELRTGHRGPGAVSALAP